MLRAVTKVTVSVLLIYWILRGTNLNEIFMVMRTATIWLVVLAFLLTVGLATLLRAYRWQILLKAQYVNASIWFLMNSYMVSFFVSNFLPSTIGVDAVRIYDTWRLGASKACALTVVFVDRLLGTFALLVLAAVGLPFSTKLIANLPWLPIWILLGTAGMLCFCWIAFVPSTRKSVLLRRARAAFSAKSQKILDVAIQPFRAFHGQRSVLVWASLLSLASQAVIIVNYYLIAEALEFSVPLYEFFVFVPLAMLVMMIPVSINAIGVREAVLVFFLAAYDVAPAEALALAWLIYGIVVLTGLLGALVYALRREDIKKGAKTVSQ